MIKKRHNIPRKLVELHLRHPFCNAGVQIRATAASKGAGGWNGNRSDNVLGWMMKSRIARKFDVCRPHKCPLNTSQTLAGFSTATAATTAITAVLFAAFTAAAVATAVIPTSWSSAAWWRASFFFDVMQPCNITWSYFPTCVFFCEECWHHCGIQPRQQFHYILVSVEAVQRFQDSRCELVGLKLVCGLKGYPYWVLFPDQRCFQTFACLGVSARKLQVLKLRPGVDRSFADG